MSPSHTAIQWRCRNVITIKGSNAKTNAEISIATIEPSRRPFAGPSEIHRQQKHSSLPKRNPRKFNSTPIAIRTVNQGIITKEGILA